ncbi:MAG: heme lyase CcmF/NrfE family subunit [bacterium]|nr:heme lyase CcmF/NrfE family subunit [bacterium]
MIVDIGYYALLSALVLTLFGIFAGLSGIHKDSNNLIISFRYSIIAVFGLVAVAYAALSYAFLSNDFTVKFVANNSSTDLPIFYKITAVWGGLEGSLLLWQIILCSFAAIVAIRYAKSNRETLPYTLVVLQLSTLFLLFLLIGWSNPFERIFPIPAEGRGLNPLLQNPGMVAHPPALYLGYVGFNIPFAFAMGSLLSKKPNDDWILTTRRWTLISWFFLTMGMILGGNWAYVELGWGGYWAWDPVENASLMPWLTGTAFLHSVMVQEKRNGLKLWNLMLIIGTFALSILGTFITRSGVLNSVHAFSKSNIGPAFLVFIALILVGSYALLYVRQSRFAIKEKAKGFLSKENGFLLNNLVFVAMAFTVFYGTVFPLLAEGLANKKISIQAPFFNSIMLPLGVFTIFLMGVTQALGWKKTSNQMLRRELMAPVILSVAFAVVMPFLVETSWQMLLMSTMTLFALYVNVLELVRSFRGGFQRKTKSGGGSKLKSILTDRRKRGGLIVHLGVVVMMIGFTGNFFGEEGAFTLNRGETHAFAGYQLKYTEALEYKQLNAEHVGARILISRDGVSEGEILPSKAFYPTRPEPMTEVAIHRTLVHDLYVSLASINEDGSATLNLYFNPMVNFVWASMGLYILGLAYSLSYKPAQKRGGHLKE